MGTKRVAISMVEGLFLFLVLETLGKLIGFLPSPSGAQEIGAGVLLIGVAYSFAVHFSILFPVYLTTVCAARKFEIVKRTESKWLAHEAILTSGTISLLLSVANGVAFTEILLNGGIASAVLQYVIALAVMIGFGVVSLPTLKRWAGSPAYQRKE